jgi:hypothetical protein
MIRRLAHLFGIKQKDDGLSKRFAKMRQLYDKPEAPVQEPEMDVVTHVRSGLNMRTVVGADKTTGEHLRKTLLESYARAAEADKELVGSK